MNTMKYKFEFELESEEVAYVSQVLRGELCKRLMNIQDSLVKMNENESLALAEIKWFVSNMDWYNDLLKRIGFNPDFDDTINRMKEKYNVL